jgi:hypothetical protein
MPLSIRRSPPHALRRSGLFGSNGLNPFIVGEFTPHDSNLQLGSLNHDPAACLNIPNAFIRARLTLLLDRAAHGDDKGCHHRLAVAGLQPVHGSQQNCRRDEQPSVSRCLAEAARKVEACQASEIFGDLLEFIDDSALRARHGADSAFEAVVEMVVNKRLLGFGYRGFHGLKLLRDLETWALGFDHLDHALQMTGGPFQSLDDIGLSSVRVWFLHT